MATPENSSTNFAWRGDDTGDTLADRLLGASQDVGSEVSSTLARLEVSLSKMAARLDALDAAQSRISSTGSAAFPASASSTSSSTSSTSSTIFAQYKKELIRELFTVQRLDLILCAEEQEDFQSLDQQWIDLLRGPSEPFKTFKSRVDSFRSHFIQQFPNAIPEERYKNNGEFSSAAVEELVRSHGGTPVTSAAYCPELQGIIERVWRTIHEMAATMLGSSKLHETFWEHAVLYAVHLYNDLPPTRAPPSGVYASPNEKYTGVRPDLTKYQPFGARAYVYIPIKRKNFGARAEQGIFVGKDKSSYPGYIIYRPVKRKTHYDDEDHLLYQTTSVVVERFSSGDSFIVGYRKLVLPNGSLSNSTDNIPIHIADIERMTQVTENRLSDSYKLPERSAQLETIVSNRFVNTSPSDAKDTTIKKIYGRSYSDQPLEQHKIEQIRLDSNRDKRRCPESDESNVSSRKKLKSDIASTSGSKSISSMYPVLSDPTCVNAVVQDFVTGDEREHLHVSQDQVDVFVYELGEFCLQESSVYKFDFQSAYGDGLANYFLAFNAGPQQPDPDSHAAAMRAFDASRWQEAEQTEIDSLSRLHVLSKPLPLPDGARVVKTKWVYKRKRAADGTVERHRARLVAKGFSQVFGEDFFDTYAPVARLTTLRLVYALTVAMDLRLAGMDVDAAFLNAELQEDLYIKAPVGTKPLPQGHVYKLLKALYGLKQSPKEWNDKLTNAFKIKDLGTLTRALNMELTRTDDGGLFVSQRLYTIDLLKKFKAMDDSGKVLVNKALTPMDHRIKLSKDGVIRSKYKSDSKIQGESSSSCEESDPIPPEYNYRALVGALLWLSMGTRPDIAYAVSQVAKYSASPRMAHWNACKRILRYLSGTVDYGIRYNKQSALDTVQKDLLPTGYFRGSHTASDARYGLDGYVDADFANDMDSRRSITGYIFLFAGAPISWQSRAQVSTALSTMEAEYMAASAAAQEALWLRMILEELGISLDKPLILREDNKSAISFSEHPGEHRRTKHIDYRHHFVRERVQKKDIRLDYIDTEDQLADILTKALDTN
eukprot:gene26641-32192_t